MTASPSVSGPPSVAQGAPTAPARDGTEVDVGSTTRAGLVLLHSPGFRTMVPAYPFEGPEIILGRDPSATIVVDDSAVSRRHARIAFEDGVWKLFDLGSRNGVTLDGERVTGAVLEPLHELGIGDALFKFVDRDAEQYARFRIDGAVDGAMVETGSLLVGGYAVRRIETEIARIAPTPLSCILLGETGTGKEVLAREVHRLSGRTGAFHAIHCAAIPETLLETELFGFRRGAFSGAHKDKPGLIQQAHKGTLFLDEVGDMALDAQVKLLRVLQSKEIIPVGGTRPEHVDLRVVCATHRDLYSYVREGRFRGDLFARLNDYATVLPPLRDRKEDIFALTRAFIARHASRRLEPSFGFMTALLRYDWPFNVRELESAVKRATALAQGGILEARDLPPQILETVRADEAAPSKGVSSAPPASRTTDPGEGDGFTRGAPTELKLRELLKQHAGNVAAVGRDLGKGRMQVHRWVRRYGIDLSDYREGAEG